MHLYFVLRILKHLLYPDIEQLFAFYMDIVAMPIIIVYMNIDINRGPQGRIAYVLIVTPSQNNV